MCRRVRRVLLLPGGVRADVQPEPHLLDQDRRHRHLALHHQRVQVPGRGLLPQARLQQLQPLPAGHGHHRGQPHAGGPVRAGEGGEVVFAECSLLRCRRTC